MVPPYSHRVSRVRRYSGYNWSALLFVYEAVTPYGVSSHTLQLNATIPFVVLTPKVLLLSVWPLPRSLATTKGISVDVFSSPYLDVSVQAVPSVYLWIQYTVTGLLPAGFPHSDIHGSLPAFGYPWLFVDRYVLLRLPVPRHPPCALLSLTCQYLAVLSFSIMLESLFFGFSLFALTHLAVQCVSAIFCLFKEVTFRSLLWLHILSFLLYSVFKVPPVDHHRFWWAQVDSNHRPHAYQACALTT